MGVSGKHVVNNAFLDWGMSSRNGSVMCCRYIALDDAGVCFVVLCLEVCIGVCIGG